MDNLKLLQIYSGGIRSVESALGYRDQRIAELEIKIRRVVADSFAWETRSDRLAHLLESLTPGGSEFNDAPERCVAWVRERLSSVITQVKQRKAAEAEVEQLRVWTRIMECGHPEGVLIEVNRNGPENEDCDLICGWCAETGGLE